MERPGGGGSSHRPQRRDAEIEYLKACGVHTVVSTMTTGQNLGAYDEAGLRWVHLPIGDAAGGEEALEEVLSVLRRQLRRKGAVAVHGNRHTDVAAAVCAACIYDVYGVPVEEGLARAAEAGLMVTPEAAALVGAVFIPHL